MVMKAHHGAFSAAGAFQAAARLPVRLPARPSMGAGPAATAPVFAERQLGLAELPEVAYLVVATLLDADSLCRVDASCRFLRGLNRASIGPWRDLGARAFGGIELDGEGAFEAMEEKSFSTGWSVTASGCHVGRKVQRVDWKGRYSRFRAEVLSFRMPFGLEISSVAQEDEVAYCRSRLRDDLLKFGESTTGAYVEIEVLANPDNLSLAVVDFEVGGRSSLTFSPDTGAVIRERKVQEAPRKVEGAYVQPLPATTPGLHFEGKMGVYLRGSHLAFYRRCCASPAVGDGSTPPIDPESVPWECTGFVTDLAWAEGKRLTPCVAFRDPGSYRVRVARVGPRPPFEPAPPSKDGQSSVGWQLLDWEADQTADE